MADPTHPVMLTAAQIAWLLDAACTARTNAQEAECEDDDKANLLLAEIAMAEDVVIKLRQASRVAC